MQKVITIAHQKGGVGKSTIALNLAVEFSKKYPTKVIDLDYQKSLSIFNSHRKENNLPALEIIEFDTKKDLMNLLDNPDSLIIIDSGGFDSDLNRLALIGADMIITPVSNNLIELYGLEAFKKILKDIKKIRDVKAHILLNKINPRAVKVINELRDFLSKNKEYFELLNTTIRYRNDYAKSFEEGKSVIELDNNSKSSMEIMELINNIEIILK